jgi:hypothetical protein
VRILKELRAHFSEVRIVKELAGSEEGRGVDNAASGERFGGGALRGKKDFHHRGRREHRDGGKEAEGLLDLDRERKEPGRVGQTREYLRVSPPYLNTGSLTRVRDEIK